MSWFNDDTLALDYIRQRGYASFSSIKNVRDCEVPRKWDARFFVVGTATHSLLFEHKLEVILDYNERYQVKRMLQSLTSNPVVIRLMRNAKFEVEFKVPINGLPVLGYIDIDNDAIGDLKTTRHVHKKNFIADMDFLQAAIYMYVTKKKDFIYIGISKVTYEVFTFSVNEYPERLAKAFADMHRLTKYIKSKL